MIYSRKQHLLKCATLLFLYCAIYNTQVDAFVVPRQPSLYLQSDRTKRNGCYNQHHFIINDNGDDHQKFKPTKRNSIINPQSRKNVILSSTKDDTITIPTNTNQRTISTTEKFSRLPVWPIWNGIILFLLSKLFGEEFAAKLEDSFLGGRVCPNFYDAEQTSPFIMLVHHRHSFANWDLIRAVQRVVFPEGFPAHPHRGFITVTYILKGGLIHRDSLGIKQTYGAEPRHNGKHTQWLTTGAGILHEEMWDIQQPNPFTPSSQELYQLWLNVPARDKLIDPKVQLLGGEEETPTVITTTLEDGDGVNNIATKTIVIAGEHGGKKGSVVTHTDLCILHVQIMEPDATWTHYLPESFQTAILYVRRGAINVGGERVPAHHTAYLQPYGTNLSITSDPQPSNNNNNNNNNQQPIADFLLLAGEPINEPIMPKGSMVMNYPNEINQAYQDYQTGKMGVPWDHTLSDEDWKVHTEKYPSIYKEENFERVGGGSG